MLITRKSPLSGKVHSMEIDVTEEQMARFNNGALAQDAFPHLLADEREFIMSGITPQEWAATFPPEDEE